MLAVAESDFAKPVASHESAFVNVAPDAVDVPLSGILPHGNVSIILQARLVGGVLCNHDFIVVDFSKQVSVVEIRTSVEQWLLAVFFLNEFQEYKK